MGTSICTDHRHHSSATAAFEGESDPYSSDEFRMYEFKIRRCNRSRTHDWTDCPFAHPGEKARRRDPKKHPYSAAVCPDFRRSGGSCPRGDACGFAHGVFEAWLHPTRYRTEACKDGPRCPRKVCFFAHSLSQLRVAAQGPTHCYAHATSISPRSTLVGPAFSPPPSPAALLNCGGFRHGCGGDGPFNVLSRGVNLRGGVENEAFDANKENGFVDPDPDLAWVDDLLM